MGYKNVRIYLEGEPGWIKAGNLTYASKEFISKGNTVLVDLRSTEKLAPKRIPRSATIPYATIKNKNESLPKKAHFVLYSDTMKP